jgi:hypothetical protein
MSRPVNVATAHARMLSLRLVSRTKSPKICQKLAIVNGQKPCGL